MNRVVMPDRKPHANHTFATQCDALFEDATTSNKAACTNADVTIDNGASGDVAVVCDRYVVLDQCTSIDDAVFTYLGTNIYDGSVHDDAACTNGRMM